MASISQMRKPWGK